MAKREYLHLSLSERDLITTMLAEGKSLGEVAKALGRSKSTVSRELKRNATPAYRLYMSHRAHGRAEERKKQANTHQRLKNERIEAYVRSMLKDGWSPELIAGRIEIDQPGLSISHEAIYQYIYHPDTKNRQGLIQRLRRAHRKRRNKGIGRKERKTRIPNRVPIDQRPESVENRIRFGHWEGDSLVSRKSLAALNSLVERKSRYLMLTKLDAKTAEATYKAVVERLGDLPAKARLTMTFDNGAENAKHEAITVAIGTRCYFARPYASWHRGANEHINGLIRWYLPKGTDFSKITDEQIARIEFLINNRPRKCLGFKKPIEVAAPFVALRG
ncbi:MAG: IS30 family transposase [Deltaproteobacteria bacterium]|nr:IS30 family transposase [Deltaproteobacteria bacterium]